MPQVITVTCGPTCWRQMPSRFEEEGIFNRETGQSFLDNILSRSSFRKPDGSVQTLPWWSTATGCDAGALRH
ncbi:hypothetical protein ACLB1E_07740 [Escherichia coli]